ncbi:MAG: hypothetical protein WD824_26400, partial [Cyclobacteriaceae bacterium]
GGMDAVKRDSNHYVVDIFRGKGGTDHVYSFHGPPGEIAQSDLKLDVQTSGTYAGEHIAKGTWAKDFPVGYSHLYNVRRDPMPPPSFILDWKAEAGYRGLKPNDDVHLRLHSLSQVSDVALADGDPPQNKPGNPRRLGYALLHNAGDNLNSIFVSVIEPYRKQPFIKSAERMDDGKSGTVAIKIERMDGGIDYVLYSAIPEKAMRLPNGISMTGTAGYVREMKGKVNKGILVNGSALKYNSLTVKSSVPIRGKIVRMNRELKGGGWLIVDKKLPTDGSLTGQQIVIETTGERDASYTIRDIQREGNETKIFCGPITFVQGYKGGEMVVRTASVPKDYTQGYLYDFEEGAAFQIAVHKEWTP